MIAPRDVAGPTAVGVGIGQCVVTADARQELVAYGLGSCVGIAAWDPVARVAGLLHCLLPEPAAGGLVTAPARFAATGVPQLLRAMIAAGAQPPRLRIVAAGGAQMLGALSAGAIKGIGQRNAAAVEAALLQAGLTLAAREFGGVAGRSIGLVVATGEVWIRVAGTAARDR